MPSRDLLEAFGPYLLLRTLGKGGMGVVYVARANLDAHPLVAVKRLRADAARVPSFLERFEHECELALRLRHPNLVETLDAGHIDGAPYVASELVRGKNLGELAHRLGDQGLGAPLAAVLRIAIDTLSALHYVHTARESDGRSLQLVHRDVTPGNIIVGYDGKSRLADFGLAKSLLTEHLGLTAEGTVLGTPSYLAPEMASGEKATPQTDLYGLGAVAYRLLAGCGPYEGTPRQVLTEMLSGPPKPIEEHRPDLPREFIAVLRRMMARRPEDRPKSARAAIDMLGDVAERTKVWVEHADLSQWISKMFRDEKAEQDAQWTIDLRLQARPDHEAGTRVLPKVAAPLSGEDSSHASRVVSTLALEDGVPLGDDLEPPDDTLKAEFPGVRHQAIEVKTEAALPQPEPQVRVVPVGRALGESPAPDHAALAAVAADAGATLREGSPRSPQPTTARRLTVAPEAGRNTATATIRPQAAAETRLTNPSTPVVVANTGPGWFSMIFVALIAALGGAAVAWLLIIYDPRPVVDVTLYERLGGARGVLHARPEDTSRASLEEKLDQVQRHLEAGEALKARVLLAEIEQTLGIAK